MAGITKGVLVLADVIAFYAALMATLLLRYPPGQFEARFGDHWWPFSVLLPIWILILWLSDLYRHHASVTLRRLMSRLLSSTSVAVVASALLFYLFAPFFELTPKTNLVLFAIVFICLDYLLRAGVLHLTRRQAWPIMVVGSSMRVEELVGHLRQHPTIGYAVVDWVPHLEAGTEAARIRGTGAKTIVVHQSVSKDPGIIRLLYSLIGEGINVVSFFDFYEFIFERVPLEDLEETWFIDHVVTRRPAYDGLKRVIDFALAAVAFVLLLPLSILIALLIKLTSPGPAVFAQKRAGKDDEPFFLYKFRTMTTWQGGMDGTPAWTEKNDARITGFGKLLRSTHLDELPQLWNIIRGDLSFTGPRAERVELANQYRSIPYYGIRHVVQPGLTGWAQINYRPSASIEEAKEKLAYDIYYVENRSLFLDIAIILRTVKYIFTSPEA